MKTGFLKVFPKVRTFGRFIASKKGKVRPYFFCISSALIGLRENFILREIILNNRNFFLILTEVRLINQDLIECYLNKLFHRQKVQACLVLKCYCKMPSFREEKMTFSPCKTSTPAKSVFPSKVEIKLNLCDTEPLLYHRIFLR